MDENVFRSVCSFSSGREQTEVQHKHKNKLRLNTIMWLLLLNKVILCGSLVLTQTGLWVVNMLLSSMILLKVSLGHFFFSLTHF